MQIKKLTIKLHAYLAGDLCHIIINRNGGYIYPSETWGEVDESNLILKIDKRSADEVLRFAESQRIRRLSQSIMNPHVNDGSEVTFLFEYDMARPVEYVLINSFKEELLELAVFISKRIKEGNEVVKFLRFWKKEYGTLDAS